MRHRKGQKVKITRSHENWAQNIIYAANVIR